uniref:Uncharacterized protein n=1 Tax=Schlesneria paludicola TaxID=360056 RepID=A0A7C4LJM8_9PLAN
MLETSEALRGGGGSGRLWRAIEDVTPHCMCSARSAPCAARGRRARASRGVFDGSARWTVRGIALQKRLFFREILQSRLVRGGRLVASGMADCGGAAVCASRCSRGLRASRVMEKPRISEWKRAQKA